MEKKIEKLFLSFVSKSMAYLSDDDYEEDISRFRDFVNLGPPNRQAAAESWARGREEYFRLLPEERPKPITWEWECDQKKG